MSYGKSFYERKIKYLDYYEGQMRIGGGGFVKLEVRDGRLRMDMMVAGLHATDTFARDVVLCGKGKEKAAGRIDISGGKGRYQQQWQNLEDIGGTGIGYGEFQGIRIPLGAGREISCRWQEKGMPDKPVPSTAPDKTPDKTTDKASDKMPDAGKRFREWDAQKTAERREESGAERQMEEKAVEESYIEERDAAERYAAEEDRAEPYRVTEDKEAWERAMGEMPDAEPPGREMPEKEREAPGRWNADEDMKTESVPGESEMRAMEGGKGDMARVGRTEARGRREHTVRQEVKRWENFRPGTDSRGAQGRAAEAGEWTQKNTEYRREGGGQNGSIARAELPDGGNRERAGRAAESENGDWGRKAAESGSGYEAGKVVESGSEYESRKTAENRREHRRNGEHEEKHRKPMEDKWSQLWAIYPHIRPFQDAREYLSISPSDFVLFPEDSYKAANNSFLLHGYYNYQHLLLARVERKGEYAYYIGVPGNFYEREKQVAIMFGFESFECAEEPAQPGDFGYYMMRTQI